MFMYHLKKDGGDVNVLLNRVGTGGEVEAEAQIPTAPHSCSARPSPSILTQLSRS